MISSRSLSSFSKFGSRILAPCPEKHSWAKRHHVVPALYGFRILPDFPERAPRQMTFVCNISKIEDDLLGGGDLTELVTRVFFFPPEAEKRIPSEALRAKRESAETRYAGVSRNPLSSRGAYVISIKVSMVGSWLRMKWC